jgi:hypothetical protein
MVSLDYRCDLGKVVIVNPGKKSKKEFGSILLLSNSEAIVFFSNFNK